MVGRLSVSGVPGGARIDGTIINSQSVSHRSAEFVISALGVSRSFTVMELPAATSAPFSVTITGISAADLESGTIRYVESTIGFRRP